MIMLVDISKCSVSHEELHARTDALAKEMGMQINLTRQEVFDADAYHLTDKTSQTLCASSLNRGGIAKQ